MTCSLLSRSMRSRGERDGEQLEYSVFSATGVIAMGCQSQKLAQVGKGPGQGPRRLPRKKRRRNGEGEELYIS